MKPYLFPLSSSIKVTRKKRAKKSKKKKIKILETLMLMQMLIRLRFICLTLKNNKIYKKRSNKRVLNPNRKKLRRMKH